MDAALDMFLRDDPSLEQNDTNPRDTASESTSPEGLIGEGASRAQPVLRHTALHRTPQPETQTNRGDTSRHRAGAEEEGTSSLTQTQTTESNEDALGPPTSRQHRGTVPSSNDANNDYIAQSRSHAHTAYNQARFHRASHISLLKGRQQRRKR